MLNNLDLCDISAPCLCVVCESIHKNKTIILQLLSKAWDLAYKASMKVVAICTGLCEEDKLNILFTYGADYIYLCNKNIENPMTLTNVIEIMLNNIPNKKMVMFASTLLGQTMASRCAVRFQVGLTAECIDIKYERNQFIFIRAALNSSVLAYITTKDSVFGMCTVKKNTFKAVTRKNHAKGKVYYFDSFINENTKEFSVIRKILKKDIQDIYPYNTAIAFGCGRGVIESGTFHLLEKAAVKYKAEIVCTRTVVEQGIMDYTRQVGQSGRSIAPYIYIAFGISGASQHIVGIRNASITIAVNKDDSAPIFNYVDYKIVADIKEILELL